MSIFSGRQHKGAMRAHREQKREEAEARNDVANARLHVCGHVHGQARMCKGGA